MRGPPPVRTQIIDGISDQWRTAMRRILWGRPRMDRCHAATRGIWRSISRRNRWLRAPQPTMTQPHPEVGASFSRRNSRACTRTGAVDHAPLGRALVPQMIDAGLVERTVQHSAPGGPEVGTKSCTPHPRPPSPERRARRATIRPFITCTNTRSCTRCAF